MKFLYKILQSELSMEKNTKRHNLNYFMSHKAVNGDKNMIFMPKN